MMVRIDSLSAAADSAAVVADSPAAVPETGTVVRMKPGTELKRRSLPEPLMEEERQAR